MFLSSYTSTIKEAGLSRTRMVAANTLLLTNSGATLGVPKICTFNTTFNDGIAAFLNLSEEIKVYVYWFLCAYTDIYRGYNQGTAQPNLNTDIIKSTLIPIPPINEQNRIIYKLKYLLPIIESYSTTQERLDVLNNNIRVQLKKSILQEAIQGRLVPQDNTEEPASRLLEKIRAEKHKLLKEGKLKAKDITDSIIFKGDDNKYYEQIGGTAIEIDSDFDFPSTWKVVRLADICRLIDGEKKQGTYICLDAKYLRGRSSGDVLSEGKFVLKGDNIILVDGENSGEVFTVPCEGYMGSTFKQLWVSGEMYLPYVLYFIQFYKDRLRNSKKGAAIPHLNKEIFYNLLIGIPPKEEQMRISSKVADLYSNL